MSAQVVIDSRVIELQSVKPRSARMERRFLDARSPGGVRVLAILDPLAGRRAGSGDAVSCAFDAIARHVASSYDPDQRTLLTSAFNAANHAVRAHNRDHAGTDPLRRVFMGLVLVCVAGDRLVFGLASPGQAIIVQNGQALAFPALVGSGAHGVETWPAAPLGMFSALTPVIVETTVTPDDLLVLGGRGLTKSLDHDTLTSLLADRAGPVEERIEDLLRMSSFAGDVLCGRIGDGVDASMKRLNDNPIDCSARDFFEPVAIAQRRKVLDDDLPVVRLDQWHTKLIDASERWFARKEPRPEPEPPDECALAAITRGAVGRFEPRHRLSPSVRSRLPRCSRGPWAAIALGLVVLLILGGIGYGYKTRQARASKQGSYLSVVQDQYDKAVAASANGLPYLNAAEGALHSAETNGSPDDVVSQWQGRITDQRDKIQGIHRLTNVASLVALPAGADSQAANVVQIGGVFFVVAGAVYQFDASGSKYSSILLPGSVVGGRTVGQARDGAADANTLVVSDGKTLFRWSATAGWTAESLPSVNADGWKTAVHGAYLGNYYLLDAPNRQILKFAKGQIDADPAGWLTAADQDKVIGAVAMVLDGSIRVLLNNGSIESFFRGQAQSAVVASFEPNTASEIGLAGGQDFLHCYVLERGKDATRLVQVNLATGDKTQFQIPGPGQAGYSKASADAFASATAFTVNEANGTVAFFSGNQLWTATFGK